jgi:arylsulfatase A-like enzyme
MQNQATNVVIFLADDLGYSDIGGYGGEIRTPNLDRLANQGVKLSNFHNTPRCSPSRASLLTGIHPHQTGIGILTGNNEAEGGYAGNLNNRCATIAEVLKANGYITAITGKWHLTNSPNKPNGAWPTERGFDNFFGTLDGCATYFRPGTLTRGIENIEHEAENNPDFFYTDAIADEAVKFLAEKPAEKPYFLYVPFTAPHWPLHAREETVKSYAGTYDEGWDAIRVKRLARQKALGIIPQETELSPRDARVLSWEDETEKEWQARRMEVYAAMVTEMDNAIGKILKQIEDNNELENTIIIFLSDNGACSEALPLDEISDFRRAKNLMDTRTRDGRRVVLGNDPDVMPGGEETYASYGVGWANVSNTPFRLYKRYTHEGGVMSPFIMHWPAGKLSDGRVNTSTFQLVNVAPTLYEALGVTYPAKLNGHSLEPLVGGSMLTALQNSASERSQLWWEHIGNAAIIRGKWKLVRQYDWNWELYDLSSDRNELKDLASANPDLVAELTAEWEKLADQYGVIPFRKTLEIYHNQGIRATDSNHHI